MNCCWFSGWIGKKGVKFWEPDEKVSYPRAQFELGLTKEFFPPNQKTVWVDVTASGRAAELTQEFGWREGSMAFVEGRLTNHWSEEEWDGKPVKKRRTLVKAVRIFDGPPNAYSKLRRIAEDARESDRRVEGVSKSAPF